MITDGRWSGSFRIRGKDVPGYANFDLNWEREHHRIYSQVMVATDKITAVPSVIYLNLEGMTLTIRVIQPGTIRTVESQLVIKYCRDCLQLFPESSGHPDDSCPTGIVDTVMSS